MPAMLKDAVPFDQVRRALVIKLRHHGDVLLSAPVLSALQAHFLFGENLTLVQIVGMALTACGVALAARAK